MCVSRGGKDPPLKNHKNIAFSSNTGLDPLKNRSSSAPTNSAHIKIGPCQLGLRCKTRPNLSYIYIDNSMCVSRGGTGGTDPPLKNHKNIAFSGNTGQDPLKNHSYQDTIQCWAIIGMFRSWANDDPLIVVLGSSLPSSTKINNVKVGPPLTKLSGSAHELVPHFRGIEVRVFYHFTARLAPSR